jgi:F5/8 type C domain/Ricin-type beta-trefoil lectin domain/Putative Ig domain
MRPRKRRSALVALALLAGGLTGLATGTLAAAPPALADPVPPPPAGWTTVFGDDFAGPAGSPPAAANWFYDIGTNFGTGEKEQTTNSTDNVYLDGNGHLVLKALKNGTTWTSARIESTRDDFQAPPGGKLEMVASIQQPNPASGLGYWPAFWALGSPMRVGGGWPQSGEIDMMEDVNALDEASQTLHTAGPSPGHPLISCPGAGSTCQTGYHTYAVIIDRTNTSAETLQFLMDGVVESTITEASVGVSAWQQAIDHGFFIIWDLAMGGNYPDGISGQTTPTAATTSGGSMSVAWVGVYEQGGDSTPPGRPTATGTAKGLNGLCLANQTSLNVAGNPIRVGTCDGSAGQQWSPYTDGTLRVQGGCLDVLAAGKTSGTNVDWYPCNASAAQNWTAQSNGTLVNPNSGLCLTVPGGNAANRLDIETCTGSPQQVWTLPTGSGGNTVTVTNPGSQTSTVGTAVNLQIQASDSAAGQTLTYGATGLPAGLSINPASGLISGTPTAAATSTVTVTVQDTTGATGSAMFNWTVNPVGGGCGTTNIALNRPVTGSAENGAFPPQNAVDGNLGTRWSSAFSDPQALTVDLGQVYQICRVVLYWEAAYARAFSIQTSTDGTAWTTIYSTATGTGGTQTLDVNGTGRFIRMYGTQRATPYGYSLWEFQVFAGTSPPGNTVTVTNPGNQTATVGTPVNLQIQASDSAAGQTLTYAAAGLPAGLSINPATGLISGTPTASGPATSTVTAQDGTGASGSATFNWTVNPAGGTCGTTNIALNRPAIASSQENASFTAPNAVDGNTGTRWSSAFSDPQWLQIDLGSTQSICQVVLNWEAAYGRAFQVQTSADAATWTPIYSTTTGTGGVQTLNVTGSGRYLRVYGTQRATQYGYSLWEVQVFAG